MTLFGWHLDSTFGAFYLHNMSAHSAIMSCQPDFGCSTCYGLILQVSGVSVRVFGRALLLLFIFLWSGRLVKLRKKQNFYCKSSFFNTYQKTWHEHFSSRAPLLPWGLMKRLLNPCGRVGFFNSRLRAALGLKGRALKLWSCCFPYYPGQNLFG